MKIIQMDVLFFIWDNNCHNSCGPEKIPKSQHRQDALDTVDTVRDESADQRRTKRRYFQHRLF